ncbi:hypothetical protein Pla52o_12120 [Novipirellula galeiformis]|uniref:Uncharacterized protein n=1 Tax=Novipirellula galeiformis TaxID=2528004 RepID=A0A5C6CLG2_9BACT|nr:hypothetical protein Pla52o_12120 [Novipirellula galeiformis]
MAPRDAELPGYGVSGAEFQGAEVSGTEFQSAEFPACEMAHPLNGLSAQ